MRSGLSHRRPPPERRSTWSAAASRQRGATRRPSYCWMALSRQKTSTNGETTLLLDRSSARRMTTRPDRGILEQRWILLRHQETAPRIVITTPRRMDIIKRIHTAVTGHALTHSLLSRTNVETLTIVTRTLVDHTGQSLTVMALGVGNTGLVCVVDGHSGQCFSSTKDKQPMCASLSGYNISMDKMWNPMPVRASLPSRRMVTPGHALAWLGVVTMLGRLPR